MAGVPSLLDAIARKIERVQGIRVGTATEITVTSGATQGLWTAIQSIVEPGDEVVLFDPAYDSYAPAVESRGGVVTAINLVGPDFRIDWARFAERLKRKPRLVIINNPHNPTGKCLRHEDLSEARTPSRTDGHAAAQRRGLRTPGVRRP